MINFSNFYLYSYFKLNKMFIQLIKVCRQFYYLKINSMLIYFLCKSVFKIPNNGLDNKDPFKISRDI